VRRQHEREGTLDLPMCLFPWLSYLAIAGMLAVLIAMAVTPARAMEFWTSAGTVAVVLAAYSLVGRGGARPGTQTGRYS
jgi:GABA permease